MAEVSKWELIDCIEYINKHKKDRMQSFWLKSKIEIVQKVFENKVEKATSEECLSTLSLPGLPDKLKKKIKQRLGLDTVELTEKNPTLREEAL